MKPWYRSKKLWAAFITAAANILAVVVTITIDRQELAAVLVASITAVGAALVVSIGVTDVGKEAAALRMKR